MGDAGYILFGPVGREVLAFGTVVFAVFATGGQLLAGQIALAGLSDNKLCLMLYTGRLCRGPSALLMLNYGRYLRDPNANLQLPSDSGQPELDQHS